MLLLKKLAHYLLLLLGVIFALTAVAYTQEHYEFAESGLLSDKFDILYIDDSENRLTPAQIEKLPLGVYANSKVQIHSPNNLDFSVWYRIQLNQNQPNIKLPISITVDNPTLDYITFYTRESEGLKKAVSVGDMVETSSAFEHAVPQISLYQGVVRGQVLYIHIETNGASATPVVIETTKDAKFRNGSHLLLLGCFLGVCLIILIYNFFMFRGVGDPSFLNYIGYVFFGAFALAVVNGFMFYAFPFPLAKFINQHLMVTHFLGLVFAIRFAISFLRFDKIKPWFVKVGNNLCYLLTAFSISGLFISEGALTPFYFLGVASVYLYVIALMTMVYDSKLMWVRYYLVSWIPLFLGVGVGIAAFNGFVPYNFATRNAAMLGVLAEVCIMAVALMDRFRANEIDKEYKAKHDPITRIPNKAALEDAIHKLSMSRRPFTLALFEVPQANDVIPALGIQSSSAFFVQLFHNIEKYTEGLSSIFSSGKSPDGKTFRVFRVSEANFALILLGDVLDDPLEYNILTVQEAVSTPIEINSVSISVACFTGVVSYPFDTNESDKMPALAYQALLEARKTESHWARFDQEKANQVSQKFELAAELQKAIEDDDLELYHQPQINIETGDVCGSELLLRWTHPEQGFIPPDFIIEIAEETGVIHQLTEFVIEKGLSQHSKLSKLGFEHTISINISGKDLNDNSLVAHILTTVSINKIKPETVVFEITESATAEDPSLAEKILSELYGQGFKIAIDDYGTGYSSLDYLSQLPFHELKIDKCFMNIDISPRNRTITEMTISMARKLGVQVVAEGVENENVVQMLKGFGSPICQGFHYAKPMSFIDYMRWLQSKNKLQWAGKGQLDAILSSK